MDFSDYAQLPKVLSQNSVYESLSDLRTLAQDSSRAYQPGDSYLPCVKSFCDGIELKLGLIPKETAKKNVSALLAFLNIQVKELMFKHAQVS